MSKETRSFQAEVKQIMNLMINSLYSHREIFLRELISNASDAIDKLQFEEIKNPQRSTGDKSIRLAVDKKAKTLTIIDNGIGMSYDEIINNIGTIAYSGTATFAEKLTKIKENPELIGQFGVGFYSAFMVADKVKLHSQKAGTDKGTLWESTGDGNYSIENLPRGAGAGTTITLHLKDLSKDDNPQDFTDEWTLRSIVRKYSDFIEHPIKMEVTRTEPTKDKDDKVIEGKDQTITKDEVFNTQKALWLKSAKDISAKEYNDFYKHTASDWTDPLDLIHYKAEGTQEFTALIFFPATQPFDYNQRDMKYGLNLHVKRVFISGNCEDLTPNYLRFLKGIVDSNDLPLNVSRELIQKDRQIVLIRKAIVSKVLRHLQQMMTKKRDVYTKFWQQFGATLKEGVPTDHDNKKEITNLLLFNSSKSKELTTLQEYCDRMPTEQKDIYYVTGESLSQVETSPYLERLNKKNFEVLFLTDPVDEWLVGSLNEYNDKKLVSVTKEGLELENEAEKKQQEDKRKQDEQKFASLTSIIKDSLKDVIKDVRLSKRLVDSPVCLISGKEDNSAHMERMLRKMGQEVTESKRILEINPDHAVMNKMVSLPKEKQTLWAEILFNQALLNEGSAIKDASKFSKQLSDLMLSN